MNIAPISRNYSIFSLIYNNLKQAKSERELKVDTISFGNGQENDLEYDENGYQLDSAICKMGGFKTQDTLMPPFSIGKVIENHDLAQERADWLYEVMQHFKSKIGNTNLRGLEHTAVGANLLSRTFGTSSKFTKYLYTERYGNPVSFISYNETGDNNYEISYIQRGNGMYSTSECITCNNGKLDYKVDIIQKNGSSRTESLIS